MRLFFILFFIIIYNFLYSISPHEIIESVNSLDPNKFHEKTVGNCEGFERLYERIELPFYFKYEKQGEIIWTEVYDVTIKREFSGALPSNPIIIYGKVYSNERKDWLLPHYFAHCSLGFPMSGMSFPNLTFPLQGDYDVSKGQITYNSTEIDSAFINIKFYVKYKRSSDPVLEQSSDSEDFDPVLEQSSDSEDFDSNNIKHKSKKKLVKHYLHTRSLMNYPFEKTIK